jgi:biopolymer transport protein ExbB/TolQ
VGFLIVLLSLLLVGVVLVVISAPLRRARSREGAPSTLQEAVAGEGAEQAAAAAWYRREGLEAAREAKYREIRDVELDYRTGKLSAEDYRTIDADLRAEAIEILNQLERAGGAVAGTSEPAPGPEGGEA